MASRHLSRISVLQALFTSDMYGDLSVDHILLSLKKNTESIPAGDEDKAFSEKLARGVATKREEIDGVIQKSAPQWPISKIAVVDRNILRIGLFELLYGEKKSVPPKVALNEAIELAKTFGGDSSGRFINGVLGAVYRDMGSPRKTEAPKDKQNEKEYLAGIVVCAKDNEQLHVALVQDPFKKWTLPKTRYENGELSDHAAVRAANEELGLNEVSLGAPLGEHEYEAHDPKKGTVKRRVGYFSGCAKKKKLKIKKGENILDAKWFTEEELEELDLYDDLREIITSGMVTSQHTCT